MFKWVNKILSICSFVLIGGELIATEVAFHPQCKIIDSIGNAVAVWNTVDSNGHTIVKSAIKASGIWSNYHVNSYDISNTIAVNSSPILYSNSLGDVVMLWKYFDSSTSRFLLAASMLPHGSTHWNTQTISSSHEELAHQDPKLDLNDQGEILVVWTSSSLLEPSITRLWTTSAMMGLSTKWSVPEAISP